MCVNAEIPENMVSKNAYFGLLRFYLKFTFLFVPLNNM